MDISLSIPIGLRTSLAMVVVLNDTFERSYLFTIIAQVDLGSVRFLYGIPEFVDMILLGTHYGIINYEGATEHALCTYVFDGAMASFLSPLVSAKF